jgi:hypothetical protein
MGPVAASGQTSEFRSRRRPTIPAKAERSKPEATSRALVPVTPPQPVPDVRVTLPRPSSAFLAQLIAANRNLPQARARRRAEPSEAIAAYLAATRAA